MAGESVEIVPETMEIFGKSMGTAENTVEMLDLTMEMDAQTMEMAGKTRETGEKSARGKGKCGAAEGAIMTKRRGTAGAARENLEIGADGSGMAPTTVAEGFPRGSCRGCAAKDEGATRPDHVGG